MMWFKNILVLLIFLACFQIVQAGWTRQNISTLAWLHDVYFFDENRGLIAGGSGAFFETKDGGKSWTKHKSFTDDTIRQIYFDNASNGWLLCERDLYNRGPGGSSYLLKTSDGGANWEKIEFTGGGRERITRIFFNQKGKGLAVGESGAFFEMQSDGSWEKQPSPIRYLLLDGAFSDEAHGTIVGAGGSIYFTEDAGASWNRANVFGNKPTKLNSLFFTNQKNGWAVGSGGRVFQTVSGGRTWREQNSGVTVDLFSLFFIDSKEGWIVGDQGLILHTTTAGNVWTVFETKPGHKLEKVFFVGKKGFAVGFGGTLLIYDGANDNTQIKPQLRKQ